MEFLQRAGLVVFTGLVGGLIVVLLMIGLMSPAHAAPVFTDEPCVAEKVLVTKKKPKKGNSTIAAWITVRSGGPIDPDAPRCTDEAFVYDLPEPELITWEPTVDMPFAPEWEEPEPVMWPPLWQYPRWHYSWPALRQPPHHAVPAPASLPLLAAGLLVFAFGRRPWRTE